MSRQHYKAETYAARTSVGYLIKRAHGLMVDNLEATFSEHGFTFTQWVVMMYLRDGLAINPSDLCVKLHHDSGALTRIIDQLEVRGLVERRRSLSDRRAIELNLLQAGHEAVESLIPLVVDRLNLVLADFSASEFKELMRLLNKLISSIEDIENTARNTPRLSP